MKHSDFVHLHVHSQYSLLDGACKIDRLVDQAHGLRMPALAISDHGNLFGAIEFYREARDRGIKPIIGCETYVAYTSRHHRGENSGREPIYHLTLLIQDELGYRNLVRLVSLGHMEGFYYKPRIDKEALTQHHAGLVALSGCLKGEVASLIVQDKIPEAYRVAAWYKELFGNDHFFLEMMDHGIPEQQIVNRVLVKMSRDLGIPLVATNDVHYLRKDMAQAHEVLLCLQTQTTLADAKHMRMSAPEFYFKSAEEMKLLFAAVPEAITNTIRITEMCNLELDFDRTHFPHYDLPAEETPKSALRKMCEAQLERRYPGAPIEARDRLNHELEVIENLGFSSYFLIVSDFVRFAKEHGIPVGPGRGSAAGSIVSYLSGITEIDPLKYDLLFERFLNPERVSLPDIDIDFCYERRDEVIKYVSEKYGTDKVAQIITFGTMMAKAVLRDVGRVLDIPYAEVDRIAKLVPNELKMTLTMAMEKEPELKALYRSNDQIKELVDISLVLEGLTRHASTHAAGVVISDRPLYESIPMYRASEGQITTGFSMKSLEKCGILKMDFLGLKTLTVIAETVKIIKRTRARELDITTIALDDGPTYALLQNAQTAGIFQLESSGMRDIVKKIKPDTFEDIIALLALYRPGPLDSGMVGDFIERKRLGSKVHYDHPLLEPMLKDTYGIILYQEQVMRITNVLAGFTLAQADVLRRAMGKKIPEEIEKLKEHFIHGAMRNGVSKKVAEKIFGLIEHFAGYGFNKSHSAAYALISYQTAYLKANYPVEFMAALLTSEKDNSDKIASYIAEARAMGMKILPPDVNDSFSQFTVVGADAIRFGLSAVKNVGTAAVEAIIAARRREGPFASLYEFCRRVDNRSANRKVMESLVKCGAFGSIHANRYQLFTGLDQILAAASAVQRDQQSGQLLLFSAGAAPRNLHPELPGIEEWSLPELLAQEKEMLGFYVSAHPLEQYRAMMQRYEISTVSEILQNQTAGADVTVAGILEKVRFLLTKRKAEKMAVCRLEGEEKGIEAVIFPETFKQVTGNVVADTIVVVQGKLDLREENPKIIVSQLFPLDAAARELISCISLSLSPQDISRQVLPQLKTVILAHPGDIPVHLSVAEPDQGRNVRIKADAKVAVTSSLLAELEHMLGKEDVCVSLKKP